MNTRLLFNRTLQLIPVLLGVSIITFLILHLAPGDPVSLLLPPDATPEVRAEVNHHLGLDQPLPFQYVSWLGRILRGDMGKSFYSNQQVLASILERFPNTMLLTVAALLFSTCVGLPLGIIGALRRNSALDRLLMIGAVFGWSMPPFWIGLVLIIVFSVQLRLLPTGGMFPLAAAGPTPPEVAKHLVLPALTLGLRHMAYFARLTRSSMLEVMAEDYVRTARGKGLQERAVVMSHALRNALIPLVTVAGISVGRLLGGAVIVETVFGWPGLGTLVVSAILARDFPLVQGSILFIATTFVLVNFAVDLFYSWLDPRIRYS